VVDQRAKVVQPEELKPGQVLVKLHYSGVCHSDYHLLHNDWAIKATFPFVGGHEGAGEIVAFGAHTNTFLKIGDKVGIKWIADACLHCEYCRKGYEQNCPEAKYSGCTVNGTFQQYVVSWASYVTPIPDNLPLELAAPILCAGVTVYSALKNSEAKAGQYVVIPGAGGGLGHLALQYARVMGLKSIAIDTGADKQKLTKELGAAEWIDFRETKDIVAAVKKVTDGQGAHAAIVAAGAAESYELALEYLRPRGTLVVVGLPPDTKIKADVLMTVLTSKRIVGSYVGNRQDAIEALELAASHKVHPHISIEPLDQVSNVFERMGKGAITGRIVLKCT